MTRRALYRCVWVLSLVVIIAMCVLFSTQPRALETPGPMVSFTTVDKSITISHPDNWKPHESSANAVMTQVWFKWSKGVSLLVLSDLQGSLMADISKASGSAVDALPGMSSQLSGGKRSPLETVHAQQGQRMSSDKVKYEGYQEGTTKHLMVANHEALATEFTFQSADGLGSQERKGTRISLLTGDSRVAVVYSCRKDVWNLISPIFEKMVGSLRLGQ
jgi:hypothetical protein